MDAETGLVYFQARYYDPQLGRFITQDPYEGDWKTPLSLHHYLYAYANPTTYVDLNGYYARDANEVQRYIIAESNCAKTGSCDAVTALREPSEARQRSAANCKSLDRCREIADDAARSEGDISARIKALQKDLRNGIEANPTTGIKTIWELDKQLEARNISAGAVREAGRHVRWRAFVENRELTDHEKVAPAAEMYGVLSGGRIVIARAVARSSVTRASITQESKTIGVTAEVAPNESLRNTSGDLRASANSARNQPYGNGQSASASPSTNSAGSSGKNVRLPRDYASELPEYDGKTTYGVLVTNEGKVIQLRSGGKEVPYSGYKAVSASHVEGKAAIWIRENASSGGTVYHNNTTGTCGYCNSQVKALLPEGVELKIVPPANAVARNSQAKAIPTINVGNATQPGRKP